MKLRLIFFSALFLLFISVANAQQNDYTLTFLALGDSYTIGESVPENQRWPVQLVDRLRKRGYQFEDPNIIAKTGWTTLDLKEAMLKATFNPPYDLVSLLIGVNDQYQNMDIDNYPANFRNLLNKAIRLSGNRPENVYVLSIPDYSVTPFGQKKNPEKIDKEIQAYNVINKRIADSLGVHYVEITQVSEQAVSDPSLLAEDGLHPSGKMYKLWVDKILQILTAELKN